MEVQDPREIPRFHVEATRNKNIRVYIYRNVKTMRRARSIILTGEKQILEDIRVIDNGVIGHKPALLSGCC